LQLLDTNSHDLKLINCIGDLFQPIIHHELHLLGTHLYFGLIVSHYLALIASIQTYRNLLLGTNCSCSALDAPIPDQLSATVQHELLPFLTNFYQRQVSKP